MTHRSIRTALAAASIALVVLVSGCGSSSATGSASGAGSSTKATAKSVAAGSSSGGSSSGGSSSGRGKSVDVCSLMPAATVAQITGEPITNAKPDNQKVLTDNGIFTCDYTSADGTSGLDLTAHLTNGKLGYNADYAAAKSVGAAGTKTIDGLGDKAFLAVDGVHALFGDVEIEVSGLSLAAQATGLGSADAVGPAKTLITTLHGKL